MRSDDFSGLKFNIGGQETYEIGMRRVEGRGMEKN